MASQTMGGNGNLSKRHRGSVMNRLGGGDPVAGCSDAAAVGASCGGGNGGE